MSLRYNLRGHSLRRKKLFLDEISPKIEGRIVEVTGWVEEQRDLGSIVFQVLRDSRGSIQVVYSKKRLGKAFEEVKETTLQSYVAVRGVVVKSKSKKYPVEISAEDYEVVSLAKHPLPLDPSGEIPASLDTRLDNRPLDLRNPRVKAVFSLRAKFLELTRGILSSEGFIEVQTPKIIGSSSEGGADLFKVDYFGRAAFLAQSPQLYKEQLTMSLERVFEVSTYYRAEKFHTTRHLNEFTSVDIEAAMMYKRDVMGVLEKLVCEVTEGLMDVARSEFEALEVEPPRAKSPFPVIAYEQVLEALRSKGLELPFGEDLGTEALRLLSQEFPNYYFIIDWPLVAKPFYIRPSPDKPNLSESFDLMFGSLELASGGQRIHERELLEERLRANNLNPSDFREHLKFFDWGMPPHSGWGFGADRFVMLVTRFSNIREVVLYPRDPERLRP